MDAKSATQQLFFSFPPRVGSLAEQFPAVAVFFSFNFFFSPFQPDGSFLVFASPFLHRREGFLFSLYLFFSSSVVFSLFAYKPSWMAARSFRCAELSFFVSSP